MVAHQRIAQQLIGDMRVDFRRAHACVTEHLLDSQQIGTAFQQMGGKAVAEGVWADGLGDAVFLSQVLDNQEDHLPCEARASAVEENRVGEFRLRRDV